MASAKATPIHFYEHIPQTSSTKGGDWRPISSHQPLADSITTLRIVTWNIWYDDLEQNIRFSGALKELLAVPSVDVVSLQEVTPQFLRWMQSSPDIRADWVLTDCWDAEHQQEIPANSYGCVMLVKRKWAANIRGWVKKFPTSKMGRFVVMMEIFQEDASLVLFFPGYL